MDHNKIQELISKYNEGVAEPSDVLQLEKLIADGVVELTQLHELAALDGGIDRVVSPTPSQETDRAFYKMLKARKKNRLKAIRFGGVAGSLFSRWIAVSFLLVIGFMVGQVFQKQTEKSEVKVLADEVTSLKEMMMISLLENESATDRLKAVSLSEEIKGPSQKVTEALFKTLNEDPSVNVRLAALEALRGYSKSPAVREGLVKSIARQQSPLVQVALAELMAALQEKSSVKELKKVLEQKQTPKEVKQRIKESINVLI